MLFSSVRDRPCSSRERLSSDGSLDAQLTVLADDAHLGREVALELALGALDHDVVAVDLDLDAARDGNGKPADA